MAKSARLSPAGLWTSDNPITKVPQGVASVARNVIMREAAIVSPRPGFARSADLGSLVQMLMYARSLCYSTATQININGTNLSGVTPRGLSGDWFLGTDVYTYFTSTTGMRKHFSGSASDFIGMPQAIQVAGQASLTTETWLATATQVAYRLVYKRKDANNGKELLGPPSGRHVVSNTSGATRAVAFSNGDIPSHLALKAGDTVQFYRSRAVGTAVTPTDEMYLAVEYVLTSTDITNQFFATEDHTPDNALGAALYTNQTQDGSLRANYQPPLCKRMALYNGSVFYANTERRNGQLITLNRCGNGAWGEYSFTATTFTLGALSFPVAAVPTGMIVGQYLWDITVSSPNQAGTYFQAHTKITSITGAGPYTIGIDKTLLANGAAVPCMAEDWIQFGSDLPFFAGAGGGNNGIGLTAGQPGTTAQTASVVISRSTISTTVRAFGDSVTGQTSGFLFVEARLFGATNIAVTASHGDSFSPALSQTDATIAPGDREARPSRIYFSKQDRHEAVPILNWIDVGGAGAEILQILTAKDALYVVKSDGLFRISGTDELNGWRVDAVDGTVSFAAGVDSHYKVAAALGDSLFVWDEYGIKEYGSAGKRIVSDPIADIIALQGASFRDIAADAVNMELLVSGGGSGINYLVFNVESGGWSEWLMDSDGLPKTSGRVAAASSVPVVLFRRSGASNFHNWTCRRYPQAGDDVPSFWGDINYAITIATVVGARVTINVGSGWTPAEGDLVSDGTNNVTVSNVVSSTAFDVVSLNGAVVPGAATAYVGVSASYEFRSVSETDPTAEKLFSKIRHFITNPKQMRKLTCSVRSAAASAQVNMADLLRSDGAVDSVTTPRVIEFAVPRAHARSSQLRPGIVVRQAALPWTYGGCVIEGRDDATFVSRNRNS